MLSYIMGTTNNYKEYYAIKKFYDTLFYSNKTYEEFVAKSRLVHGDLYDYSQVDYKNSKTKVTIICPKHGSFEQKPEKHWIGHGCPQCAQAKVEATNLKKYGVRRPLQNSDIHKKMETLLGKDNLKDLIEDALKEIKESFEK